MMGSFTVLWWEFTVYDESSRGSRHTTTLQCSGIVYTGIYVHVINIYLHKRFNTTVNLVYTVIYSCILLQTWYIISYTLVYDILSGKHNLYLVYMPEYQVYEWSFSMPCHMEGRCQAESAICLLSYLCHKHLQFLFIPSSWLCNSGFDHLWHVCQVVRIPVACVKYWHTPSIYYVRTSISYL